MAELLNLLVQLGHGMLFKRLKQLVQLGHGMLLKRLKLLVQLGHGMPCPNSLGKHDDAMHVVGHDAILIELSIGEVPRYCLPAFLHDLSDLR